MMPRETVTMRGHDKCLLGPVMDEPWKGHSNDVVSSLSSELLSQGLSLDPYFSKNKADFKNSGLS